MAIEPTDEDFDDMHHALGRPDDPSVASYRNYYCVAHDSPTANRFRALGWWIESHRINKGRDGIFTVNDDGRKALCAWMQARSPK